MTNALPIERDPTEAGAAPQRVSLRDWEAAMRSGVDAARNDQPATARRLYLRALAIAHALLAGAPGDARTEPQRFDDDRVAAFVVSHLNLADLCREADQIDAALAHVCSAHQTLMGLARDERTAPALRQAARRHSRETHAALLQHLETHGSHPDAVAALRAGCMPFPWPGATRH